MALSSQIDRAAAGPGKIAVGSADLSDHTLAMPAGDPEVEAAERRDAGVTVADRLRTHECGLSRKARITVCLRKGHVDDAEQVREFLQALGLMEWNRVQSKSGRLEVTHRPAGRCPVCRTRQHVRMDMTIGVHRRGPHAHCDGEGQRPLPEEEP